jgi:hypothetical protein
MDSLKSRKAIGRQAPNDDEGRPATGRPRRLITMNRWLSQAALKGYRRPRRTNDQRRLGRLPQLPQLPDRKSGNEPPDRRFWLALVYAFNQFEEERPKGMTTVADVTTVTGRTFTALATQYDHRAHWLRLHVYAHASDEKPERIVAIPAHTIAYIEIRYERAGPELPRRPLGFSLADESAGEPESRDA